MAVNSDPQPEEAPSRRPRGDGAAPYGAMFAANAALTAALGVVSSMLLRRNQAA
jgi:hypothetical protein